VATKIGKISRPFLILTIFLVVGGFFIFSRKIFSYLKGSYDLETDAFESLVKEKQISAFKHDGFWKCMNTFKDTMELNELWNGIRRPGKFGNKKCHSL